MRIVMRGHLLRNVFNGFKRTFGILMFTIKVCFDIVGAFFAMFGIYFYRR